MDGKNYLFSKTLWVNILALAATWLGVKELASVEFQEEIVVTAIAVINIILRFLTKEPLKLK